jgi:hypothetical protein
MSKTTEYNQILPQLGNCDMIANHWAKELLTIFHTCIKEWKENQHLKVCIHEWKYEQHLHIKRGIAYSLVISSSMEILKNDDDFKNYTANTLLFISTAKSDEAVIFQWSDRDTPICTIRKSTNGFIITSGYKEDCISYRKFEKINQKLTEVGRFTKTNLAKQGLNKTRSKGAINSNRNSDVQRIRKKGKLIKGSTVWLIGTNIFELKTMKDTHEFIKNEYGYEKVYRTLVRELKEGKEIEFRKGDDFLQISLMK